MAQEGDSTFQEAFSMTNSTDNHFCYCPGAFPPAFPFAIWMTHWWPPHDRAKLSQPLKLCPGWRKHLLQGSGAAQLTQLKLLLLSYLISQIFLLGAPPPWGKHSFSPLAGLSQKKQGHSPSGSFGDHHSNRTQVNS